MSVANRLEKDQLRTKVERYARLVRREWKLHAQLIVTLFVLLVPLVLVLLMSTQSTAEILDFTYIGLGSDGLDNYRVVLEEYGFLNYLKNSFVMASLIAVGKVGISMLAALAIVFFDFRFKRFLFLFILLTLTLPVPVRIVPLFEIMVDMGWNDTMYALVLPYLASATSVLLLRQHFLAISESLVETARLNGVGPLKFLVYVLIPMSKSMIIGLFVIAFIWGWNQYLWPLVAIQSSSQQVVQVGLAELQGATGGGQTLWGLIMAGTVLALLPPLIILILANRPLLETFNVQMK